MGENALDGGGTVSGDRDGSHGPQEGRTHSVGLVVRIVTRVVVPIAGPFPLSHGRKPAAETLFLTRLSTRDAMLFAAAVAVLPPGAHLPAARLVLRVVVVQLIWSG
jgi:hypothetical protein